MEKYRKKPVVIEAVQWDGTEETMDEIALWCDEGWGDWSNVQADGSFSIPTLEGEHLARVGEWIIKGVAGEFYPCKPDIFEKTYERVS